MTTHRNVNNQAPLASMRTRLAASGAGVVKEPEAEQPAAGKVLMNHFSYDHRRVISDLRDWLAAQKAKSLRGGVK